MKDADDDLTAETERLDDEITETKADLDIEVSMGEIRQESLNDHNVRITVIRGDVDANAAAILGLGGNVETEIADTVNVFNNQSDTTMNLIYEMDRTVV